MDAQPPPPYPCPGTSAAYQWQRRIVPQEQVGKKYGTTRPGQSGSGVGNRGGRFLFCLSRDGKRHPIPPPLSVPGSPQSQIPEASAVRGRSHAAFIPHCADILPEPPRHQHPPSATKGRQLRRQRLSGKRVNVSQDVKIARWPLEREKVDLYRKLGIPRVLILDHGEKAPPHWDAYEDWVRAPFPEDDLRKRIRVVQERVRAEQEPRLGEDGLLHYRSQSVALSAVQSRIVECLIRNPGALVPRADLIACLSEEPSTPTRNALDLHVTRIRRKLAPLGLAVKAVRGRGYRLHASED